MVANQRSGNPPRGATGRTVFAAALFVVIGVVVLVLPDDPNGFHWPGFRHLPLEVPVLGLILLLVPRRLVWPVALLATVAVFAELFLKIADIGVISAFQRKFNPYLDIKMIGDGWNVLSGAVGSLKAGAAVALVLIAFFGGAVIFYRAQRALARAQAPVRRPLFIGFGALLAIGVVLWGAGPSMGLRDVAQARAFSYLEGRLTLVGQSVRDMRAFEGQLAQAPAPLPADLFQAVKGRDVVLVFVESYGRSAVEDPRYAPLIGPRLASMQRALSAAGFASASGWSKSPTVAGLSWLAHGTFLSGLWVDNQARYDRLIISRRPSLNRVFQDAGWETAAVMPAITAAWPEARYFGYDETFAAKTLGYRGKPFNWITMPDQFTLTAIERLVRGPAHARGRNVMVETALISSHAPWTPVPHLIDWNDVGDGTVFDDQAVSDQSPRVVWSDPDNIRSHYIGTIDYSLQALGDYISKFGGNAVFVILGDHQPASIVTGEGASRAVPVHIVSRDKALIAGFERNGFSAGMTPAPNLPERPMDQMRDLLIRLFSGPAAAGTQAAQ